MEERLQKLLIVSAGNISNNDLTTIFEHNIETLKSLFEANSVVEIDEDEIVIHY